MKNTLTTIHSKQLILLLCVIFFTLSACVKEEPKLVQFDGNGNPILEEQLILDESRLFLNYVIPQEKYDEFVADDVDFTMVSSKIYEYFKDDFDFMFILADEDERPEGAAYGRTLPVSGTVTGLGTPIFDNSLFVFPNYRNEEPTIQSIIYMPLVDFIHRGPFLHEIAHTWGNRGFIPSTIGWHWGYSSVGGQLGGFDEYSYLGNGKYLGRFDGDNGFGLNANGGNGLPFSNTELYLMGMIPVSELNPIDVAVNPENTDGDGFFTADSIKTYTVEELIANNGERIPDFSTSQKEFKAITIIISTSPISEERKELAKAHLINFTKIGEPTGIWEGLYNFYTATLGAGILKIKINNEDLM